MAWHFNSHRASRRLGFLIRISIALCLYFYFLFPFFYLFIYLSRLSFCFPPITNSIDSNSARHRGVVGSRAMVAAAAAVLWQPREEGLREICALLEEHISPNSDQSRILQQLQHYNQLPDFNNYLVFILAHAEVFSPPFVLCCFLLSAFSSFRLLFCLRSGLSVFWCVKGFSPFCWRRVVFLRRRNEFLSF